MKNTNSVYVGKALPVCWVPKRGMMEAEPFGDAR